MSQVSVADNVPRHRTAMVRHTLSRPISLLIRYGLIRPGVTVFDYGCGQGDDLRGLAAAGIPASGWDPHFAPEAQRQTADVVNLGFVLNVIEAPTERRDALEGAWALTGKVLSVASMVAGQVPTTALRPFGDGFMTSRGTFQKYFHHSELRDFVRDIADVEPVAVAPGIFFLFRNPADSDDFLIQRRVGRRASTHDYRPPRRERSQPKARPDLHDRIPLSLSTIADFIRMRGRTPHGDELPEDALGELAEAHVSLTRALDLSLAQIGDGEVQAAASAMREDLLVHFALSRLNRSPANSRPSAMMIRDIRAHFGSQQNAHDQANAYLFSLSKVELVEDAILNAVKGGLGAIDAKRRFIFNPKVIGDLPGPLRLYVGCASYLAGDPDDDWLIRVDPARKRVIFLKLDDQAAPLPTSSETILIDLARQSVTILPVKRLLIAKSRVLGNPATGQRELEESFRAEHGLDEKLVMIRWDER